MDNIQAEIANGIALLEELDRAASKIYAGHTGYSKNVVALMKRAIQTQIQHEENFLLSLEEGAR